MRTTRAIFVPVVAAAVLAGCGSSPDSGTGDAGGAGETEKVRLVLPHAGIFTVGLPYAVAKKNGFFADNGVEVEPIFTSGGGANVLPVVSGAADVGMETGAGAVLAAAANGGPVCLVAGTTTGSDILFFSKGNSPYKDLPSLSGQKVGISSPGSSTDFALGAMNEDLEAEGLEPAQVQPLGSPPEQLAAVTTGQVAAGWTIPPTFLDKIESGELQIAFNAFDELPQYDEVVGRAQFVNAAYLDAHPEAVSGITDAWQQAWDWAFANQDEAIEAWRAEADIQGDPATLKKSFDFYERAMFDPEIKGLDQAVEDHVSAGGKPLTPEQLDKVVCSESGGK